MANLFTYDDDISENFNPEGGGNYSYPPQGIYDLKINNVEFKAKEKNPQFTYVTITFEVVNNCESKGCVFDIDFNTGNPNSRQNRAISKEQILRIHFAITGKKLNQGESFDINELLNGKFNVNLVIKEGEYNGKKTTNASLKNFKNFSEQQEQATTTTPVESKEAKPDWAS